MEELTEKAFIVEMKKRMNKNTTLKQLNGIAIEVISLCFEPQLKKSNLVG